MSYRLVDRKNQKMTAKKLEELQARAALPATAEQLQEAKDQFAEQLESVKGRFAEQLQEAKDQFAEQLQKAEGQFIKERHNYLETVNQQIAQQVATQLAAQQETAEQGVRRLIRQSSGCKQFQIGLFLTLIAFIVAVISAWFERKDGKWPDFPSPTTVEIFKQLVILLTTLWFDFSCSKCIYELILEAHQTQSAPARPVGSIGLSP